MSVDLHTHSTASDGTETPAAVVQLAAEAGLSAIALTDHDTLDGISTAQQQAQQSGIELIPGVEISCRWEVGTMHMVILFLEETNSPLQERLPQLREGRNTRNKQILERLSSLEVEVNLEEVLAEARGESVGRPHIAAIMQKKGYVSDLAEAFDKFLGLGRPAYVGRPRLTPQETISLSQKSGAVSILAHPHTLALDRAGQYAEIFEQLAKWGLVGVECFYSTYDPTLRQQLADTAAKFGLLPSGGSDFHGSYRPGVKVGSGQGDLNVPDWVLEDLRAARPGL